MSNNDIKTSAIVTAEIWHDFLSAQNAISDLRDKCYKLASAYYHEGDPAKQKLAYTLADKYQAFLEEFSKLEEGAIEIRNQGCSDGFVGEW